MKTILWAEDDENLRKLYKAELEPLGYSIEFYSDGRQAFQHIEKESPDLVVTDIVMPGGDGLEMIGLILSDHVGVPIIVNTAYPAYGDSYLRWAVEAFVIKSSDLTELKDKIKTALFNAEALIYIVVGLLTAVEA